eukprot:COSAG05_NODE_2031_length_3669_cov_1.983193_2_plen_98_part_00
MVFLRSSRRLFAAVASPASSALSAATAAFTSLPAGFPQLGVKLPARLLDVAWLAAVGADPFRFQPSGLGGRAIFAAAFRAALCSSLPLDRVDGETHI